MSELIQIANHIHNTLSSILVKYHKGVELADIEDEFLSDIYIAKENDYLKTIEELPLTENKYLKQIIMSRNKTNQGGDKIPTANQSGLNILDTEVLNISGKQVATGNAAYLEVAKLIEKGTDLATIHTYCIQKSNERHLTVKEVLKTAVLNSETDPKASGAKYEAYKLAMKIESGNSDFTDEERISLKKATESVWPNPEIVGFVWTLFNFSPSK
jgi:hypothetical protein